MTQVLTPKLPGDAVAYVIPWAHQIGDDWIESFTLTVDSGTVIIDSRENSSQNIVAVISGGADGETAELTAEIVTKGGQTLSRPITLLITAGVSSVTPSTATKRTIVTMAFEEMTLAGYEFDAPPEEQFSALRRLDALMAEWAVSSLDVGYSFPAQMGGGDLDDESGVPDVALNAIAISLAERLMPTIGKTKSPETRVAQARAMNALRAYCATIPERSLANRTPLGSGNKPWSTWQPFSGGRGRRRAG
jgi:hypothetical protein